MKLVLQVLQILLLVSVLEGRLHRHRRKKYIDNSNTNSYIHSNLSRNSNIYSNSSRNSNIDSKSNRNSKIDANLNRNSYIDSNSNRNSYIDSNSNSNSNIDLNSTKEAKCERSYYRPIDGYCNNLKNPTWGTPSIPFVRLFPNHTYEDGLHVMANLPNPRKISLQGFVHLDGTEDPKWTLNTIVWGQLITHDMGLIAGAPQPGDPDIPCSCVKGKIIGKSKNENFACAPILVPEDDPYNVPEGIECMSFVRTKATCDLKCKKPAEQINRVNSYLDASYVYGNTKEEAKQLRLFKNGMLSYQTRHGRMYPPQTTKALCHRYLVRTIDTLCLQTGDLRANQNPYISLAQSILLRYHNKIAEELCTVINTRWDDETCYQEARRIVIATIQHITYNEFLTFVLGKTNMIKRKMIPTVPSIFDNVYDEKIDASCINEHSGAAFRVFHSGVQGSLKLMTQNRKECGRVRLSDHYDDSSLLLQNNTELGLATGFSTQHQFKIDRFHDSEINQVLFRYDDVLGLDLFTIDILRGRDHGLASYAVALKECGLGDPKSFDDFGKYMPKENVRLLKRLYDSFDKVELRVGGQLESIMEYSLTGPTFNCIMLEQFARTKRGDYYWYENEKQDCSFTREQLKSIKRSATVSSLICNHVDGLKRIQKMGFEEVNVNNPMMDCKDLPTINLTLWKEDKVMMEEIN